MLKPELKVLTPSAKEAVLYANTPFFLLEKLRKDSAIQVLLNNATPEEIFSELTELPTVSSALDIAWKYLLIVALTMGNTPDKWRMLSTLDLSDLEWGEAIWQLAEAQDIPTETSTLTNQDTDSENFRWNTPELVGG